MGACWGAAGSAPRRVGECVLQTSVLFFPLTTAQCDELEPIRFTVETFPEGSRKWKNYILFYFVFIDSVLLKICSFSHNFLYLQLNLILKREENITRR